MPLWYQNWRSAMLLLQQLMFSAAFGYAFRRRGYFGLRFILSVAAGMLLAYHSQAMIYIPGDSFEANLSHAIMSIVNYVLLMGVISVCLKESGWTILFLTTMSSVGSSMAGCLKTLLRMIPQFNALTTHSNGILLADILCYGGLALIIWRVFRFYTRLREDATKYKDKIIFSTAAVVVYVAMSWLIMDYNFENRQVVVATNSFAIMILGMVYMIQFGVMERARLTASMETMRELIYQQKSQYDTSRESVQLINEKYHDLKNIIGSLRDTLPEEEVRRLKKSIKRYDVRVQTGLEVLDIVLTEKMDICVQRGITLTCNAGGVDFSFMEELDVYALFNNALTNAINAVMELADEDSRFIILLASQDGNMVSIHVENPCREGISFVDGIPQSEGDPNWHGFGMKSMVRTAEKYGGVLTASQENGRFRLDILLLKEK